MLHFLLQDLIAKLTRGRERRNHVKRLRLNLLAQDTYTKDEASVHLEVHSRIDEISIPCMNPLSTCITLPSVLDSDGHHENDRSPLEGGLALVNLGRYKYKGNKSKEGRS